MTDRKLRSREGTALPSSHTAKPEPWSHGLLASCAAGGRLIAFFSQVFLDGGKQSPLFQSSGRMGLPPPPGSPLCFWKGAFLWPLPLPGELCSMTSDEEAAGVPPWEFSLQSLPVNSCSALSCISSGFGWELPSTHATLRFCRSSTRPGSPVPQTLQVVLTQEADAGPGNALLSTIADTGVTPKWV